MGSSVKKTAGLMGSLLKRRRLAIFNTILILLIASAVTVVSMKAKKDSLPASKTNQPEGGRELGTAAVTPSSVQQSSVDGATGQKRPLTPGESQQLAEGIKTLVDQSTDGLKEVQHKDGSVSIDLEGRFQNVMLATQNEDGTVTQACVNDRQSAAEFLQINPELVGGINRVQPNSKANTQAPSTKEELK